ncbi:MAG: DUF3618 domain-containing protein [Angustibacter sp.]
MTRNHSAPATADSAPVAAGSVPESRKPAEIEAHIEMTRQRLAGTVDELSARLQPHEIGRRAAAGAGRRLRGAATTPDGSPRVERAVAVVVAVVAVLVLATRSRRRRSR